MDLSNLPKDQVQGLDRNLVESDRKNYWEQFFKKVVFCLLLLTLSSIFQLHFKVLLSLL